jgi:polyhydroxyalkanoate synthase
MEAARSPARSTPVLTALFEEQRRTLSRLLNVPRVVDAARQARVGTTPHTVVLREGTHTLLRYVRGTPARHAEPVLLCYALVNRPYILDLQSDKSVVRQYLDGGFDVYMIDWGVPSDADRARTVEDYVCGFLASTVDFIRRKHDRAKVTSSATAWGGRCRRCTPRWPPTR